MGPLGACGDDGRDPEGATVTDFRFDGQFPSDPFTVVFSFAFEAGEAGLGERGQAQFFVGSSTTPVTLRMADLFASSDVPRTARGGELGAAFRFSGDDIPDGAVVNMSLQLVDDAGKRSNKATVQMKFDFP